MKLKNLILGLFVATLAFSCEEDGADKKEASTNINCETFVTTDYLTILQDLQDKAAAYTNDPTTENCQAYIASVSSYVDAWKGLCEQMLSSTRRDLQDLLANVGGNTRRNDL